ncbi:DUF692 domain-containing protein [Parasphingopyxis algicola]|uniref:DUF692 domain-containing protein n=1 Tax=Parasphingopyxis algicola TaxID=2026624 RepID=UPI0015A1559D|nr:DUF692 family multinuclear iron-containing protein [Parasphingopyxis algicola]QLC23750.1 DUF692 domain-containing protein [Parasphingopyxis algicola]
MIDEAKFASLLDLGKSVLVHSVGCPVASTNGFDDRQLDALRRSLAILKPAWWSDHASFVSTGNGDERRAMGFLMPPAQTHESVAMIVDRIKRLQDLFGLPFAFETGVNYFAPRAGEMPDGAFWGEIAVRADCGILLDLHNIWSNQRNGRDDAETVLAQLPRDHVWEIHVAGGQDHNGYWLDSHCGLPQPEVIELLGRAAPGLPNLKAINFEIIPEYVDARNIDVADIRDLLGQLQTIWYAAKSPTADCQASPVGEEAEAIDVRAPPDYPSPAEWEDDLRRCIDARCRGEPTHPDDDPAFDIYVDLILMARRGSIVDVLPLTTRYLWLSLGEDGLDALLLRYFAETGPEPFMADEARNFARFSERHGDVPHLAEVTAFEFAAQKAAETGMTQLVRFSCDPVSLLTAIRNGIRAEPPLPADIEVEVQPPILKAA